MPLSKEAQRKRNEDLAACTIGHEAVKDAYMLGVKKWEGIRAERDRMAYQQVWLWVLAYMIRRPKERISRKAYLMNCRR